MIAVAPTLNGRTRNVAQTRLDALRLMDGVRDEAAVELATALSGISVKRMVAADVPGASAYGISRAVNGADSNPLYRLVAVFVLLKRLGLGRERALRILGWLREVVDQLWPEEEARLDEALEEDSKLDPADDHARFQVAKGCVTARRELLEVSRRQVAQKSVLIAALRRATVEG